MRVLALTKYGPLAASTRQRFLQYRPFLEAHGMTLEVEPLLGDDALAAINGPPGSRRKRPGGLAARYGRRLAMLRRARDHDLLWVQYELFPYLPGLFDRLAVPAGTPVVLDFDDAIFHIYDQHRRGLVRRLLGRKLEPLIARAAACICGNAYLRAYAGRFCPETVEIPTVVDTDLYCPPTSPVRDGPLVVGWLGSPTTWLNVEPLLPTILPLLRAHNAVLHVIGAGAAAQEEPGLRTFDWAEARELADLQAMDIGIMPLLDRPFQRGKCGYKLIQYMACGIPAIASPVGVNSEIVAAGGGLLASTPEEWRDALARLLGDAALRRRLGAAGREAAVARYSLASQAPRVLAVLRTAVERHGRAHG